MIEIHQSSKTLSGQNMEIKTRTRLPWAVFSPLLIPLAFVIWTIIQ